MARSGTSVSNRLATEPIVRDLLKGCQAVIDPHRRVAEYPAVVSMLDASLQARHALKRWRRSISLAVAERVRDQVQVYLDLVLLAQRNGA